ncbi:Inherit from opiNOG: protein Hydra magnipapillata [Seminavis robusta]|uniref:Inherit from opiNOG: protein Hydra magnipapillata n=1 Tax=Seminavis robusta TaxID=568900 RepID=A0A9N8HSN7_9STRA|nr:Inherit from opiNOG: protein Hydra magnipapillata [Seminavis robusta]|eukprot:Sro1468_g275190.1 Inherit from opiNOG: protein Hydra magnipapillata (197) ;mRNA; r:9270-9935
MFHWSPNTVTDWFRFAQQLIGEVVLETMENYQIGGIGVEVEIDESKFGKRKYHRGHRVDGVWVFGGVERTPERKCFLVAVEDRKKPTLEALIEEFILPGSIIVSDKFPSYEDLEGKEDFWYQHEVVNHSQNYKDPITGACTNTIEGTWNGVKKLVPARKRTQEGVKPCLFEFMWRRMHSGRLWRALLEALATVRYV